MTAWVLMLFLGTNYAVSVPGIESETECRRLGDEIEKVEKYARPKCFSYRGAYRF
jgi:hypothetical protein